ncbi:MAG: hypothetical protein LBP85_10445 [Prevotellaceae bacterium]|jgi:hypothetical protein|nr:hypothetical protein [Prevotellaceae bacterium]
MKINGKKITEIDILSERFTFGQRLEFNRLSELTYDHQIIEAVIYVLYEIKVKPEYYVSVYGHVKDVLTKLNIWNEKEKALQYEPTPEEIRAGINQISDKLKEFATVDAIAKRMHISHDDSLKLPYSTVYMMLLADFEHSKFERRLSKIYENKYKI